MESTFYDTNDENYLKNEWFGLKSSNTPKQIKELIPFENDLTELVRKINLENKKPLLKEIAKIYESSR